MSSKCKSAHLQRGLIIIFLLATLILSNCTSHAPTGWKAEYNWYPLSVGNLWSYRGFLQAVNLRPDSLEPRFPLTETRSYVEVESTTTLPNDSVAYCLREEYNDDIQYLFWYIGFNYFKNQKDGLYHYAYYYDTPAPPYIATLSPSIYFAGQYFRSLAEVSLWVRTQLHPRASSPDQVILYDQPLKSIQYPLRLKSSWLYNDEPWTIEKIVVDRKKIEVSAGEFWCYQIQWLFDINGDGIWDEEIEFNDYVSDIGIVKRTIVYRDLIWIDEYGNEVGIFDLVEENSLSAYRVSNRSTPVFPPLTP